jgi:hypothetical protein
MEDLILEVEDNFGKMNVNIGGGRTTVRCGSFTFDAMRSRLV